MSSSDGKTMLTDLYQLTMGAAYFDNGKNDTATFELFIRKLPEKWGYFVAAGIEDAIDYATNIKFEDSDIQYLREQRLFSEDYLSHLKDLHFEGDIYAVKEGTPVFPNEPLLRVTGPRDQAQFLESALLNIINSQTLIASKASRVVNAAAPAKVVDFGLRRAQGEDAAMTGARAAYIGGCVATSNVKAGKEYGIPISGTHAHSFVMSFDTELDAFRAYTKTFPDNATLLIDYRYDAVGRRTEMSDGGGTTTAPATRASSPKSSKRKAISSVQCASTAATSQTSARKCVRYSMTPTCHMCAS